MTLTPVPLTPQQVERIIERGGKFLRAVSTVPAIAASMAQAGYTDAEHQEGWNGYLVLVGFKQLPGGAVLLVKNSQVVALANLDQWDEPNFERARRALEHRHPEAAKYMFNGLEAATGAAAVATVKTFVDRYVALRDGTDPERAGSKKADRSAAETLEQRKIIDPEIAEYLRSQLAEATSMATAPAPVANTETDEAYTQTLLAFEAWLEDWRETARTVVKRRDHLIRLGLASRRQAARDEAEEK